MRIFALIFLFFPVLFSCKKKSATQPSSAPVQNASSPVTGVVSTASVFSGFLFTTNTTFSVGNTVTQDRFARAEFTPTPGNYYGSNNLDVGDVFFNSDTLIKYPYNQSTDIEYQINTNKVLLTNHTWSVSGGNGFPAFVFTNTVVLPGCTGFSIPDTISKSAATTMSLNGVSYTGAGSLNIQGSGTNAWAGAYLYNGNNTINLSQTVANLDTFYNAQLFVILENYEKMKFGSKDMIFTKQTCFGKTVRIVP